MLLFSFYVGKEKSEADRKEGSKQKAITMGTGVTDNLLQRPWLWFGSQHTTVGKKEKSKSGGEGERKSLTFIVKQYKAGGKKAESETNKQL